MESTPINNNASEAEWMKSMAEPTRLCIIRILATGPKNVGDIAEAAQTEVVNVSHHLGRMKDQGILTSEKNGRYILYRLKTASVVSGSVIIRHESGASVSLPMTA